VKCSGHGVVVKQLPWNEGKPTLTLAMMCFLARRARRLSWRGGAGVSSELGSIHQLGGPVRGLAVGEV